MKRWFIMIGFVVGLVVVLGGLWGFKVTKQLADFEAMSAVKQTVTTMIAQEQEWPQQISAVGSLHATRGADLATEVAGVVDTIHFESGTEVKAGSLLVELRVGDDVARLASLRAGAELAELTHRRAVEQYKTQAISKAEFENAVANTKIAQARLAEQQAMLDKKRIRAPFAGQLGIRKIDPGQYVGAGDKIVTLQTLDSIYVDFFLPQHELAKIRVGQRVTATSDTYPDQLFSGAVSAIDPKVDIDTRNLQVRATLKNPEHKLLPGMFANVQIEIGRSQSFITLPLTAVAYNSFGTTAFVVAKAELSEQEKSAGKQASGSVAKQIFIDTGATRGDQVAVLKGIAIGDEVVTSGQLKLKNDSPVTINNAVIPANDPNPRPSER